MRVLLTGASGMVGANLVHRCIRLGLEVSVLIRSADVPLRLEPVVSDLRFLRADLLDADAVAAAVAEAAPEVVVHMASTPFNPPPAVRHHVDVNVSGTANLMTALARAAPRRVVFTGSAAQYGSGDRLAETDPDRPDTLLGITKLCAAEVVHGIGRMAGIETVELRLFTPYGPWERPGRLVPHTILSALRGEDVVLGDGRPERDWTFIDDVVDALLRAMAAPVPTATRFNVCSGRGIPVRDIAARILALLGDPVPLRLGVFPPRPDEIWKLSGDNEKARTELGWVPLVGLDDGLRSTIEWFRTHRTVAERLS